MQPACSKCSDVTRWPALDFAADGPVGATLHAWLQVVGKLPVRTLPWVNHGWHVALRVAPHGFRTYPLYGADSEVEVLVDLAHGRVQIDCSTGHSESFALEGQSVARFAEQLGAALAAVDVPIRTDGAPNEVPDPVPFAQDTQPRPWDGATARRLHAAFRSADRVFETFRTGFVGKSSPSHMFWGSFDLAVTRFSGRRAPLHPGGIPALSDRVTREAYSHEVASAGFWLGGGGTGENEITQAAFYAYGYPTPNGLADHAAEPADAYWHDELGEYVLPYAAVRAAKDPDALLLTFLQTSYAAIAEAAEWDRAALEIPTGRVGEPRTVA